MAGAATEDTNPGAPRRRMGEQPFNSWRRTTNATSLACISESSDIIFEYTVNAPMSYNQRSVTRRRHELDEPRECPPIHHPESSSERKIEPLASENTSQKCTEGTSSRDPVSASGNDENPTS